MVAILNVPCIGLTGWQTLNEYANPETWRQSKQMPVPLANLAGNIAEMQLKHHRHFISEHPQTTEMYHMAELGYVMRSSIGVLFINV